MADKSGYFDDEKNVEDYISMAEGYDGRDLIDQLAEYLPAGSRVLELGMGPGKDLDILAERYDVTGSDSSRVFLDRYRALHPDADILLLDAVNLETDRTFDAVYSNKVLHHLDTEELKKSFHSQTRLLPSGGIALHSFWLGEGEETIQGMRFTFYNDRTLRSRIGPEWEVLESQIYTEMEEDDSLVLVARKR